MHQGPHPPAWGWPSCALLGLAARAAVNRATGQPWHPPGPGFPLTVAGGLLAALAVASLSLPLIDTMTRHESVRFD